MRECVGVGVGEREWVCARESKRESNSQTGKARDKYREGEGD